MTAAIGFKIVAHDPPPPLGTGAPPSEAQAAAIWQEQRELLSRTTWHTFICKNAFRPAAAMRSCSCWVWALRIPNSKTSCQAFRPLAGAQRGLSRRQPRSDFSALSVLLCAHDQAKNLHDQGGCSCWLWLLTLRKRRVSEGCTLFRAEGTGSLLGS